MAVTTAALCPHSSISTDAARAIRVSVDTGIGDKLVLAFRLSADTTALRIPPPLPAGPADGLWRQTCFEAFAAIATDDAYREFNFSPSGQWAAYAFSAYRVPAPNAAVLPAPQLAIARYAHCLALTVSLPAAALPPRAPGATLRLGLATVVETSDGALAYWALAHPGERPDFHHRDSFALTFDWAPLPSPSPAL